MDQEKMRKGGTNVTIVAQNTRLKTGMEEVEVETEEEVGVETEEEVEVMGENTDMIDIVAIEEVRAEVRVENIKENNPTKTVTQDRR